MSRQYLPLTFVLACLAGFLALTAGLKLQLLTTNPFADIFTGKRTPSLWLASIAVTKAIAANISLRLGHLRYWLVRIDAVLPDLRALSIWWQHPRIRSFGKLVATAERNARWRTETLHASIVI
jgi:hypothetical protein